MNLLVRYALLAPLAFSPVWACGCQSFAIFHGGESSSAAFDASLVYRAKPGDTVRVAWASPPANDTTARSNTLLNPSSNSLSGLVLPDGTVELGGRSVRAGGLSGLELLAQLRAAFKGSESRQLGNFQIELIPADPERTCRVVVEMDDETCIFPVTLKHPEDAAEIVAQNISRATIETNNLVAWLELARPSNSEKEILPITLRLDDQSESERVTQARPGDTLFISESDYYRKWLEPRTTWLERTLGLSVLTTQMINQTIDRTPKGFQF